LLDLSSSVALQPTGLSVHERLHAPAAAAAPHQGGARVYWL